MRLRLGSRLEKWDSKIVPGSIEICQEFLCEGLRGKLLIERARRARSNLQWESWSMGSHGERGEPWSFRSIWSAGACSRFQLRPLSSAAACCRLGNLPSRPGRAHCSVSFRKPGVIGRHLIYFHYVASKRAYSESGSKLPHSKLPALFPKSPRSRRESKCDRPTNLWT